MIPRPTALSAPAIAIIMIAKVCPVESLKELALVTTSRVTASSMSSILISSISRLRLLRLKPRTPTRNRISGRVIIFLIKKVIHQS